MSTMEKSNPPKSFGVFKPVGHTIMVYPSAEAMEAAALSLADHGIDSSAMVRYTPGEMKAQVESNLETASALASVGQELNLVKAHRALAEQECSFLVVYAPDDESAAKVDAVIEATHPRAAQRYGSFVIEELVESIEGETQVFESPDRGLDIDVPART